MSIRKKITALLILFSVIPCILTGLFAISSTKDSVLKSIAAHGGEYVSMAGAQLNVELFKMYEKAIEWSEDDTLLGFFSNKNGREEVLKTLGSIEKYRESVSYLALLGIDGRILGGSDEDLLGHQKNFLRSEGFNRALSGKSFMEDVAFDELGKGRTLLLFTPIRDSSDVKKVRGVLLASFRWDFFSRVIQSVYIRGSKKGGTGHFVFARKNGYVISGSDHHSVYGSDLAGAGLKAAKMASQGKEGYTVEKNEHNDLSITSYAPLPDYEKMPNPGWLIILHQDYRKLFTVADKTQNAIMAVTLLLALFLFYLSFKVGKMICDPILNITSAAKKVGMGDFTGIVDVAAYGESEIKALAESFNFMLTELERSREQLFHSHEYLSGVFSSMSDCLIVVCAGKIKEVNWAALTALGYSAEELIGREVDVLFVPGENPLKVESASVEDLGLVDGETMLKTRSGETFPVLLNCSKLYLPAADPFDELDNVTGDVEKNAGDDLILIAKDITERKEMEEELISSRKAAIEASRAKGVFLSNMSHEIRTPMNAIMGMTSLVLDLEKDPEKIEYLEVVKLSAEALLTLLNDLLDISKIEAGKLELQTVDFDLRQVLHDSIKSIAFNAHSKNLEVIVNISPLIYPVVNGDPIRLRQVIINLVGNAIKFTDVGEIELKVAPVLPSAESDINKEGYVNYLFSVRDTGKGIPDQKLMRIFDSFYQVDDSDSRRHDGTGLGLAICREIVELMGGRIWAESEPGMGTTFFFNVKLFKNFPAVEKPKERTDNVLKGKKILIVDDNKTNRILLKHAVESSGCEAVEAVDGSDAMDKFSENLNAKAMIDLVLMDYYMPGVNGVEAVRMIKDRYGGINTKFLILSSGGMGTGFFEDKEGSCLETILKPINQAELLHKMSAALKDMPGVGKSSWEKANLPPTAARKNCRILLAEDKKINQMLAVKLLEKQGYTLKVAQNGKEAIAALKEGHFDLVLMDVRMPEMDGLEATQNIRASDPDILPVDIPIVAMSAFAMEEDIKVCLDAGMNDHVPKPVDRDKLFAVLDKWLPADESP